MGNTNYFNVILGVLADWNVIATVIAMAVIVEFAKFITTYKKRPRKIKADKNKKKKAPVIKKKAEEKKEDDEEGEKTENNKK